MDGIKGDDLALLEEELKLSDPVDSRLDQGAHEAYVVPDGFRGIQEAVVGPGRYYVNTLAVTPVVIPTTNQTSNGRRNKSKDHYATGGSRGLPRQARKCTVYGYQDWFD
ncbi:MAG TPA: hypothetical protein VGB07_12935 [Blastocatellia bacterium]